MYNYPHVICCKPVLNMLAGLIAYFRTFCRKAKTNFLLRLKHATSFGCSRHCQLVTALCRDADDTANTATQVTYVCCHWLYGKLTPQSKELPCKKDTTVAG